MQELTNLLTRHKLTPNQLLLLHCIQENTRPGHLVPQLTEEVQTCQKNGWITQENQLESKALQVLLEADKLFKSSKKRKQNMDTPEFMERLKEYRMIFPAGNLPTGKPGRTNINELKKKMTDFFIQNPDYDWDLVLDATSYYVEHFRKQNFNFMKTAGYFISKINREGVSESELASYCEMILEGQDMSTIKKSMYTVS